MRSAHSDKNRYNKNKYRFKKQVAIELSRGRYKNLKQAIRHITKEY